jgi:hypothetical protein
VSPNLPRTPQPYLPHLSDKQTVAPPAPAFGDARSLMAPVTVPQAAAPQPAAKSGAGAAAAVQNLTPGGPKPAKSAAKAQQNSPKVDEKARQESAREQAERILAEKRRAEQEKARQEKLAKEQQKRDAEAAKKAGEEARRQAERDREQQKAVDEAAAKLKAAEAAYNAELAKKNKQE